MMHVVDFIRILLNDLCGSENKEIEKGKRRSNPAFGVRITPTSSYRNYKGILQCIVFSHLTLHCLDLIYIYMPDAIQHIYLTYIIKCIYYVMINLNGSIILTVQLNVKKPVKLL